MRPVCGVIAEYNPLHQGHIYHLQRSRAIGPVVCVMSGPFTQRGEPAVFDKWLRTKAALEAGADLVLELPAVWACAGAERFAAGAIRILSACGVVTHLCFGSESADLSALEEAAQILAEESPEFQSALAEGLHQGLSFAQARARAAGPRFEALLRNPNDILGVEYLKALRRQKSPIQPAAILRRGGGYLENRVSDSFPSALSIRTALQKGEAAPLLPIFEKATPVFWESLAPLFLYRLRSLSADQISQLPEVSEGLENRLIEAARKARNGEEFLQLAQTRRYPSARIRRSLVHALLGIHKEDLAFLDAQPPLIRVLGVREESKDLLGQIAAHTPVVTNPAASDHPALAFDIAAGDLYSLLQGQPARRDFTEKLVVANRSPL